MVRDLFLFLFFFSRQINLNLFRRSAIAPRSIQFVFFADIRPAYRHKVGFNFKTKQKKTTKSFFFFFSYSSWCLKLYPKGVNEKSVEYISLFVKYVRGRSDLLAKAEFSLINSRGEFHIVRKTPYHVFPTGGDWGYSEYLMRMVLTTQRKAELLNSDQSLKIFARVIIVGESTSSMIHEEKKNTYESLVSLSTHFGSLLNSAKDNSYDVTIHVRPEQIFYENKSTVAKRTSTNHRAKRKRYTSGASESSDELAAAMSMTFYAHRSILSVRTTKIDLLLLL